MTGLGEVTQASQTRQEGHNDNEARHEKHDLTGLGEVTQASQT